jgi:hypothetical protein
MLPVVRRLRQGAEHEFAKSTGYTVKASIQAGVFVIYLFHTFAKEGDPSMFRLIQVLCLSLLLAGGPLLAQSGLGSITGVVQDSSGGIVARAAIRLTQRNAKSRA